MSYFETKVYRVVAFKIYAAFTSLPFSKKTSSFKISRSSEVIVKRIFLMTVLQILLCSLEVKIIVNNFKLQYKKYFLGMYGFWFCKCCS